MAWPLGLDEAPLTASAIFAITEVMKEEDGKCAECAGRKERRATQPGPKECVRPSDGGDGGGDAEDGRSAGRGYLNKGCADGW